MHGARFTLLAAAFAASHLTASIASMRPASAQESQIETRRAAATKGGAPADGEAALALGTALRRAGRDAEATKVLTAAAAATRPGDLAIRIRWELARAAIDRREFRPAMASCRMVAAMPTGDAAGHACAAEAHLLYQRASEALTETAAALAGGRKIYEAKVAEGVSRAFELKEADAEAALREAISWQPERWEAHLALGRLLVGTGRRDDGIAALRRARELDANGPEAAYELGRALAPAPEATPLLQRAVAERPTFVAAWLKLSEVALAAGRAAEARAAAQAALKSDPRDHAAHTTVGRVALAEGNADEAIAEGRAALAILANSAAAKLLIADAYAKKREIDLAVESYQGAYGLNRRDPSALVRASEACLALDRPTSAKAFGEKAVKEFPAWGPAHVALGDALAVDKDLVGARAAYERALKGEGPVDKARVKTKLDALPPGRH